MKTKMLFQCLLLIAICGFSASAIPIKAEKWKPIKAVNLSDDHWGKSNEALMGDFSCSAGEITFANFAFATINVCTINVPASVEMQVEGQQITVFDGTIINYIYLLTDEANIILSSSEGNVIETSDLAVGNFKIYGFIYTGELTGNTPGQNVFSLEAEGCEAWSDFLEIRVNTCESPDCPELEADFFSFCDDGNTNTTTDLITLDCECVGTCEVVADVILFPGESTSEIVCFNDDQPTFLSLWFNSSGTGADGYIIISDPFGDFLLIESSVSSIDNVDFNQFGAGSVFIQAVSYEPEFTNADELAIAFNENGITVNLADISGCAEISNSLEVQGIVCAFVVDCPEFDANIGDPCDDMNPATENDVITDECGCEGVLVQTYDCDELMADIGDPCNDMNPATENDVITDECGCEGELVQTYECEELIADFGDPCDDLNPETVFDIITNECVCLGLPSSDCDVNAAPIEFYDPENAEAELGDSQNFCALDGIPSLVNVRFTDAIETPNMHFIVTDEFGNYLNIHSGVGALSTSDFDQYGLEPVYIQSVQYYGLYSNAFEIRTSFLVNGTPTNLSDLDGCFAVSNQLEMVGQDCEALDCPELAANFGAPCDDMNSTTENDLVSENCECVGTPITECEIEVVGIMFTDFTSNQTICANDEVPSYVSIVFLGIPSVVESYLIITNSSGDFLSTETTAGLESTDFDQFGLDIVYIRLLRFEASTSNADELYLKFNNTDEVTNISDLSGCYFLSTPLEVEGINCETEYCIELEANVGDPCDDGIAATFNDIIGPACECIGTPVDCTNLLLNIGDPCDDGNPLTNNDTVSENCQCTGTPDLVDCTNLLLNIGDPCDDGNPLTNNDTVSENCQCTGTPDLVDCPSLMANIGDPCDDGDENTIFDEIDENCECSGITIVIVDCVELMANVGDPCDDGNPATQNDAINNNCECAGEPFDLVDCVEFAANFGDPCDDGDPATQNDVINNNCECAGEPFDLVDCIEFAANFGDPCDDGNPATQNDVINNNCECAGEPFDLVDCIKFAANFGDPCDDGNPATQNDVINNNCECAGEPFDLVDCIEFAANIGDPCDDGNPETLSDVITAACTCEGEIQEESCANFAYYLSDVANDGTTVIYGVELDELSLEATLHFLKEFSYEAHIAFNETDGLMYVVRTSNGAFRTLDVSVSDGAISGETTPDMLFTKVIAAAINEDGKLVVGDEISDQIIAIDIPTGTTSPYAMGDVSGGDITFGLDGRPYLATRSGNILYQIMPGPFNLMLGNTPNLVTGMATMADGMLLLSAKNANVLEVRDENGVDFGVTYDLIYEGETFFTNNGDLASGCADNQEVEDVCPGIKYYYAASNTPGVPPGTVMEGVISGGNLVLSELFSVGFEVHMAANNESGELYIVDKNGTELRIYSTAGVLLNTWALELSQTIALAWNPLDGLIYVGSADQNAVFQVDPANGSTNLFASNMPVNGGDIVATPDGDLFLIERSNSGSSKLYNITSGLAVFIANVAPAINGAALTGSGGFIMAQGAGANQFHLYDQLGVATGLLSAVDEAGIALQLFDGDMA